MEAMNAVKEQSTGSTNPAKSKLRYPLRSARKIKEDKLAVEDGSTASSAPKRVKPASNVSKSVSALTSSKMDKPVSRRLSVPGKTSVSPLPRSAGIMTPISEARTKKPTTARQKNGTPTSDVCKTPPRKKFSVLSSASYWLSQIKISESAIKHSVSLGFFKLALESGCEPMQRMRDELKSYSRRHNLVELGEPLKELLRSYNVLEDTEEGQVSETFSPVPGEVTQSSDENVQNSSSKNSGKELKFKTSNAKSVCASSVRPTSVTETAKKLSTLRISPSKNKGSVRRNSMTAKSVADVHEDLQKKSQRPSRKIAMNEKVNATKNLEEDNATKNPEKESSGEKDLVEDLPSMEIDQEDKENKDTQQAEVIIKTEVIQSA